MRIALDARLTRQMSVGMKTYARELTARLPIVAPEFQFVPFHGGRNFDWSEQVKLPKAIVAAKVDLTHYLAHYVPWFAPKPYIITIHDLIHLRFSEFYKSKVGPYYRTAVKRACKNAALVITDDERTIADLERFLDVPSEKIRVIPLGVGAPFLGHPEEPYNCHPEHSAVGAKSKDRSTDRPYFLYVGNHRAHKDLPTFFDAWSSLPGRFSIDMYVTGPDDFEGELQRRARLPENVATGRRIIALGDVGDEELTEWYRGATALVHPALCEGFGLPLLEAMACGCPVIVSADAVPGVLAPASLVFPTKDVAALRGLLERVLVDEGLRARLVNEGGTVARMLTWDRCARAMADVYCEIIWGGENSAQ